MVATGSQYLTQVLLLVLKFPIKVRPSELTCFPALNCCFHQLMREKEVYLHDVKSYKVM